MTERVGGVLEIKANGVTIAAKGDSFTYNTGQLKREMVKGVDRVHGTKSMIQVPFIEGATTDLPDVDTESIKNIEGATVILRAANGKTIILRNAAYTAEGDTTTEEGEIQLRFEGLQAEVIAPEAG